MFPYPAKQPCLIVGSVLNVTRSLRESRLRNSTAIVASELVTKNGHCGYVVLALDGYTQESAVENIDLIDTIMSLMSLVGGLIEKTNKMQGIQMKNLNYSKYSVPSFN